MKRLLTALITLLTTLSSYAFVIDYDAINDNDNVEYYRANSLNYASQGSFSEDGVSRVVVPHDRKKGIATNEDNEGGGLKLEGVNKEDLENLYYGNELYNKTK
ncbi:hypothetical protein SAMN02910357_00272 [Succinivibrio dextrinosolvens]|uniref:hypothetical protein n=1 Tax=Succinivibrio dextrinosolvens TaxID=83771 RepID=UPI0008E3E2FA|nr:hypothetical protein [Succinivibrio dextrinosolvens]SFS34909.1 hypothetical protein SAMN02910357_00272 [Succinivibrio dextrinosolvens]